MSSRPQRSCPYALRALRGSLLLSGCAVGPDFQRPRRAGGAGLYARAAAGQHRCRQRSARRRRSASYTDKDIPGEWWQLFHSQPLDALVAQALEANPTLAAAQAALRQAQENVARAARARISRRSRPG